MSGKCYFSFLLMVIAVPVIFSENGSACNCSSNTYVNKNLDDSLFQFQKTQPLVVPTLPTLFRREGIKELVESEENFSPEDNHLGKEPDCPKGQWWHIRGQRCVPVHCPGGNSERHTGTGECIRKVPQGFLSRFAFRTGPLPSFTRNRGPKVKNHLGIRLLRGRMRG